MMKYVVFSSSEDDVKMPTALAVPSGFFTKPGLPLSPPRAVQVGFHHVIAFDVRDRATRLAGDRTDLAHLRADLELGEAQGIADRIFAGDVILRARQRPGRV